MCPAALGFFATGSSSFAAADTLDDDGDEAGDTLDEDATADTLDEDEDATADNCDDGDKATFSSIVLPPAPTRSGAYLKTLAMVALTDTSVPVLKSFLTDSVNRRQYLIHMNA